MSNPSTVLVYPDPDIINSRVLATGTGLSLAIGGPQGFITINPGERLSSLAEMPTDGIVCYTASTKTYNPRSLVTGLGIGITNPTGQGSMTISQIPQSVVQKVQLANSGGSILGSAPTMKFIAGSGIALTLASDGVTNNVTIANTSGDGTVTSVGLTSSNAFITVSGSPITSSGTLAMTINTLSIAKGGTGGTTQYTGFNNLSPITTSGDLIIGTGTNISSRLPRGVGNTVLQINPSTLLPNWAAVSGTGTVFSVDISSTTGITVGGGPIVLDGTLTVNLPGTGTSSAVVSGDLLVGGGAGAYAPVAIGANRTILSSTGTTLAYVGGASSSGNVLTYNGTDIVWAAPATSGTVTNVGVQSTTGIAVTGSPITSSGTITLALPGSGMGSGVAPGDILAGGGSGAYEPVPLGSVNRILASNGTVPIWVAPTPAGGNVLTFDGADIVWAAPATSGTVTSVGLSSSDAFISVGGSPITSSGTLAMTINTLSIANGGTGQTTAAAAFSALSPMTTTGDMIYSSSGTTAARLAVGAANTLIASNGTRPVYVGGTASTGKILTYNGSSILWSSPATSGTVTSVNNSSTTGIIVSGGPITSSGSIAINLPGTGASSAVVTGDLLVGYGAGAYTALGIGAARTILSSTGTTLAYVGGASSSGNVLTYNGTNIVWAAPATSGTVTSVGLSSSDAFISVGGSPVTSSGTLAMTINTLSIANGGTGQTVAYAAFNALAPTSANGDLIYYFGGSNQRLPISATSRQVLQVQGNMPVWGNAYTTGVTIGVETGITTTRTVATSAVAANSYISLTISGAAGAPTIAPAVRVGTITAGTSFQIVPIAVTGGGGKATSIDVIWKIDAF